jgi:hypothetical protein
MQTEKVVYETGATSHAVNDLILFTDNTRELVEFRDSCYKLLLDRPSRAAKINEPYSAKEIFMQLFDRARKVYYKELPGYNNLHIRMIDDNGSLEYCLLYAADWDNWKKEHGY